MTQNESPEEMKVIRHTRESQDIHGGEGSKLYTMLRKAARAVTDGIREGRTNAGVSVGVKEHLIDKDTARKVAHLARIRVEEDALPALADEFNTILGFIEQLNEVDVDGVEPMTSVTPMRLKRRVDEVTDGNQQDKVLKNAPDAREGFFAVPKVVE